MRTVPVMIMIMITSYRPSTVGSSSDAQATVGPCHGDTGTVTVTVTVTVRVTVTDSLSLGHWHGRSSLI